MRKSLLAIFFGVAFLYHDSFFAPFYRDDWFFLKVQLPEDLVKPISDLHYLPISIQGFYWLMRTLFEYNVLAYHLFLFVGMLGVFFLVYILAKDFLQSDKKALVTTFFFAFNISLFAIFYWVAGMYFVLGPLFYLSANYFYLKRKIFFVFLFYLLAIGSNEIGYTLPGMLLLVSWYKNIWDKKLVILLVANLLIFFARIKFLNFPVMDTYQMKFDLHILKTIQWYLLRTLNLPEAIRLRADPIILVSFGGFLATILFSVKKINPRLFIFGVSWFLIGGIPFYFLPFHLSSYYATLALFGICLLLVELITDKRIIILSVLCYLVLSFTGLQFLKDTHWIIRKDIGWPGKFNHPSEINESSLAN